jgi:hypothetical protein
VKIARLCVDLPLLIIPMIDLGYLLQAAGAVLSRLRVQSGVSLDSKSFAACEYVSFFIRSSTLNMNAVASGTDKSTGVSITVIQ